MLEAGSLEGGEANVMNRHIIVRTPPSLQLAAGIAAVGVAAYTARTAVAVVVAVAPDDTASAAAAAAGTAVVVAGTLAADTVAAAAGTGIRSWENMVAAGRMSILVLASAERRRMDVSE